MEATAIDYRTTPPIATITINRPGRRNSLDPDTCRQLGQALSSAGGDDGVHVVVITGVGEKAFCAGADLDVLASGQPSMANSVVFADLFGAMLSFPKPLIAKVNGHALGGGLGLVLSSHLAIVADHALLGTPEVKVGLFPMVVSQLLLTHLGPKKAHELILTGRLLGADEAAALGLVNRVCPISCLDQEVETLAHLVAGTHPDCLHLGLEAMWKSRQLSFGEAMNSLGLAFHELLGKESSMEGVRQFLARRVPKETNRAKKS